MITNINYNKTNENNIVLELTFDDHTSYHDLYTKPDTTKLSSLKISDDCTKATVTLKKDHLSAFLTDLQQHNLVSMQTTVTGDTETFEKLLIDATIPAAPTAAMDIGYNVDGYYELLASLSAQERKDALQDMESPNVIARAEKIKSILDEGKQILYDTKNSRELFLAGLLLLRKKKITKQQLASLHILDSAIRTLCTDIGIYMFHEYVNEKHQIVRQYRYEVSQHKTNEPNIRYGRYNFTIVPYDNMPVHELPSRMQYPMIYRFFNFNDYEWMQFKREMEKDSVPESERIYQALVVPDFGSFSTIISRVQSFLSCMQILDWKTPTTEPDSYIEKVMIIPSFTMLQTAINIKAAALGRAPVELVPTYYYVAENDYYRYKTADQIPMTLYLPEHDKDLQYNSQAGKFRTNIDGHPGETAFAGVIHDMYHAFRELNLTENIAAARVRLASIAEKHPDNCPRGRNISDILMDGELIFSYSRHRNSIFKDNFVDDPELFGEIFYSRLIKNILSDSLKRAFIRDMVENSEDWRDNFNIGRNSLRAADQIIYDEIEQQLITELNNRASRKLNY